MPYAHLSTPELHDHLTPAQAIVYGLVAILTLLAVYEYGFGVLLIPAIGALLASAAMEKAEALEYGAPSPSVSSTRLLGDGGSFPGERPKPRQAHAHNVVLDGGSLENHHVQE